MRSHRRIVSMLTPRTRAASPIGYSDLGKIGNLSTASLRYPTVR
jgi:hypothetical protein